MRSGGEGRGCSRRGLPGAFAALFDSWISGTLLSPLRQRVDEARSVGVAESRMRTIEVWAVGGALTSAVSGFALFGTAGALLGVVLSVAAAESAWRRSIEEARLRFSRSFPDALDLLAVACMAGMNPYRAFKTVAGLHPPGCEQLFASVGAALRAGMGVTEALRQEVAVSHRREVAALLRAISGAERLGHPLGPVLMRLSADLRERQVRLAQSAARKAPVKVLFPLVFCILPAFVLLTVVPVLADTFAVIRQ